MSTFSAASSIVHNEQPLLQMRLLGEFSLTYGNNELHAIGALRLQSLLAFLVLHGNVPLSRRHVAFTFWPDSGESQARTNLRRELHNLRQALPMIEQFLRIETQTVQWRTDAPFLLDVAEFEDAVAAAHLAEQTKNESVMQAALAKAVALYKGDLLPGCYEEWLLTERERLRQVYLQTLEKLIVLLQKQQEYRAALEFAKQLLREDPLAEEAYLYLIQLYALVGDRARALRTYHACVSMLQRELAIEPGPRIRQAYATLLQANTSPLPEAMPQTILSATSPLVGRQAEWHSLHAGWLAASRGHSQLAAVTGEAGIGKTRLVEELVEWATEQNLITAQTRCYASAGGLAYAPVTEWLRTPALRSGLQHLEAIWLTQIARLLPELLTERPELPSPEPITDSWQRQHFFEALARAFFINARPLLLVIDDLQWSDEETLAWLDYLLRFSAQTPLLVAATIRSPEIDTNHPLSVWLMDLRRRDRLTEIVLGALSEGDTAVLANHIAGAELEPTLAAQLYKETEGHPLFVVEMVRAGVSANPAAEALTLSPKIQAVIESRLAKLSAAARRIANLAATIGRAFAFDVLAEASQEDEAWLVNGLDELWQSRIIRELSANEYDFSHNKIREVVYSSLSAANKRLLHRRIAGAMETVYAANLTSMSKQIAPQYEAAGMNEQAVAHYLKAGQIAQQIYANSDAIYLYTRGLLLLQTLPDTPERATQELALQRLLSVAYRNTQGYSANEVGQALSRARQLSQQLNQTDALGPILWGLFTFNFVRSDLHKAHELGQELFDLALTEQNSTFLEHGHYALGGSLCSQGEFEASLKHFNAGIALYDPGQHRAQVAMFGVDLGVFSQAWSAHALWHLGYLDQALQRNQSAMALVKTLQHPFSQALAMAYTAMLFQFRRDSQLVVDWASATIDFCAENDVGYYGSWATILHGWALAEQGMIKEGIDQMQKGLDSFRHTNSEARVPYYLTLLAESYARAWQIQEGLRRLDEALAVAEKNKDTWYSAETHRLLGELKLSLGAREDAERHFSTSLELSHRQQAKILTLRTTVSLSRLWLEQNRREKARDHLIKILDWFSEGADLPDLQAARMLIAELS